MAQSPGLTISFDNPDPLDSPGTFMALIALLNTLIHGDIDGDWIPYITGAENPAVDDQDKVWHRTDANGRPMGTFVFYSGTWRKQYTTPIGMVSMYSGDPAVDFAGTGGAGTVGGQWDGWQLMNGQNGISDLSNKFIVGAKMSDLGVGYPSGAGPWRTDIDGTTQQSGDGVTEIQLDATNTYRPAAAAVTVYRRTATGETPNAGGGLYGLGPDGLTELAPADAGVNPDPIPTLPPYFALAYAIFKGYE